MVKRRPTPRGRRAAARIGPLVARSAISVPIGLERLSMPNATILGHLGLFVRRGFLSPESCRQIRSEMAAAARVPAMIRPRRRGGRRRRSRHAPHRRRQRVGIDHRASSKTSCAPSSRRWRNSSSCRSTGWQRPQFYIYEQGDFFAAHRDSDADDPVAPDWVKRRQVSVSILLNDARGGRDAEPYGGGSLVFHGAPRRSARQRVRHPAGERGGHVRRLSLRLDP